MNVGVDYSIMFYDGTSGQLVTINDIQDVQISALNHQLKNSPYNTVPIHGYVPDGYRVEFSIVRTGSVLEDYMVAFSKNFNNGVVQNPGYLNESIINPDGSVSRYQYTNFVVFLTDHGQISRDKVVTLKLEGMASDKVAIS
jgi:hypothetical protein